MSTVKQFLVNIFSQFGASIFNAAITFIFTIYATNRLGTSLYGQFSIVQIYVSSFYILTDIGITNVVVRQVAQNKGDIKEITGNLLAIKAILGIIVFFIVILGAYLLRYPVQTLHLIIIYAVSIIAYSLSFGCNAIFNGKEKLAFSSVTILGSAAGSIFGLIFLFFTLDLKVQFGSLSFAYIIALSISVILLRQKFAKFFIRIDWQYWKSLITEAWPFGAIFILNSISMTIGPVMLSKISGDIPVGYFNLSNKMIAPVMFFISAYNAAIFPFFSRLSASSESILDRLLPLSLRIMMVLGFSITFFIILISKKLILFLFPIYEGSVIVLQILSWNILFGLLATATLNYLYSRHREKWVTWMYVWATLLSLLLNAILIPRWGVIGLGISQVILTAFLFFMSYYLSSREMMQERTNLLFLSLKGFLGAAPLVICGILIQSWPLFLFLSMMLCVFSLTILFSPAFNQEDREILFKGFIRQLRQRSIVDK